MDHRRHMLRIAVAIAIGIATLAVALGIGSGYPPRTLVDRSASVAPGRTPVVLFPAFHLTRLDVSVHNQTTDGACPRSGNFEDWYQNDRPSTTFNQVCRDELMTLRYQDDPAKPMARRFFEQSGVRVRVFDYGKTDSAPFYEPLYKALEAAGYHRDEEIRVAGYDSRLTPDMDGFLARTKKLVEQTYRENGNRPVQLVAHSNGPLYAQYLLAQTTATWRRTFIHGFTAIAGNFPGQGIVYSLLFTGLNIQDMSYPTTRANSVSSARMYLMAPSTWMSAADPTVFGDQETVVQNTSTGRRYTPKDYPQLLTDAGLTSEKPIADHYIGFVGLVEPGSFPNVDVHAEKGSGLPTVVGARLPDLNVGQVVKPGQLINVNGDSNQEDITNNAIRAWAATRCHRFSLTDNPGIAHYSLPTDPYVIERLLTDLTTPPTDCPT